MRVYVELNEGSSMLFPYRFDEKKLVSADAPTASVFYFQK